MIANECETPDRLRRSCHGWLEWVCEVIFQNKALPVTVNVGFSTQKEVAALELDYVLDAVIACIACKDRLVFRESERLGRKAKAVNLIQHQQTKSRHLIMCYGRLHGTVDPTLVLIVFEAEREKSYMRVRKIHFKSQPGVVLLY